MFCRAYGNVKTVMQCKCPEQNRFRAMVTIVQMGVSQFCQYFNKLGKLDKFHLETLEQLRLEFSLP